MESLLSTYSVLEGKYLQIKISGVNHKGEGVGRIDGKVVFIPFAIPDEEIKVKNLIEKKSFSRAEIDEIVEPSKFRTTPVCEYFTECGGCAYQHISYEKELELKEQIIQDSFQRIAKMDVEIKDSIGVDYPYQYRNKVTWHVFKEGEKNKIGFYNNSSKLMEIKKCYLLSDKLQGYSERLANIIEDLELPDNIDISIRYSNNSEKSMLVFHGKDIQEKIIDVSNLLSEHFHSIYCLDDNQEIHICGDRHLTDNIMGIDYSLSSDTFMQINNEQNLELLNIILNDFGINKDDKVLDAYCGIGNIALQVAKISKEVLGIESSKRTIKSAKHNVWQNEITNVKFKRGLCEEVLPLIEEQYDIVILDPPRTGCEAEAIKAIPQLNPRQIIYISCNPATLARDCKLLAELGYETKMVQPIDMFSQTGHVETVVLITRVK